MRKPIGSIGHSFVMVVVDQSTNDVHFADLDRLKHVRRVGGQVPKVLMSTSSPRRGLGFGLELTRASRVVATPRKSLDQRVPDCVVPTKWHGRWSRWQEQQDSAPYLRASMCTRSDGMGDWLSRRMRRTAEFSSRPARAHRPQPYGEQAWRGAALRGKIRSSLDSAKAEFSAQT